MGDELEHFSSRLSLWQKLASASAPAASLTESSLDLWASCVLNTLEAFPVSVAAAEDKTPVPPALCLPGIATPRTARIAVGGQRIATHRTHHRGPKR